jgi:hypothetical protein
MMRASAWRIQFQKTECEKMLYVVDHPSARWPALRGTALFICEILTRVALDRPFWHLKEGFHQTPQHQSRSQLLINRRTQNILDSYSR